MKSNPYYWTRKQINKLLGETYMAADGGPYGIKIVGYIMEKHDFIAVEVLGDSVRYDKPLYRIDFSKASYRYKLPKEPPQ